MPRRGRTGGISRTEVPRFSMPQQPVSGTGAISRPQAHKAALALTVLLATTSFVHILPPTAMYTVVESPFLTSTLLGCFISSDGEIPQESAILSAIAARICGGSLMFG